MWYIYIKNEPIEYSKTAKVAKNLSRSPTALSWRPRGGSGRPKGDETGPREIKSVAAEEEENAVQYLYTKRWRGDLRDC